MAKTREEPEAVELATAESFEQAEATRMAGERERELVSIINGMLGILRHFSATVPAGGAVSLRVEALQARLAQLHLAQLRAEI